MYKNLEKSKFKAIKTKKSEIYLGIENLINSITGSEKLLSSGEDGYKALELTIASMLSFKLNKKIELHKSCSVSWGNRDQKVKLE